MLTKFPVSGSYFAGCGHILCQMVTFINKLRRFMLPAKYFGYLPVMDNRKPPFRTVSAASDPAIQYF